ncbi:hypothetical protein ILYODFUR_007675 [Ilyodon furcidens]|uniref:Uncharacterized protein n=1 Tax=Ilyodon furcidens TaxID=33524 RepID=A0ABV0VC00_9TELE
MGWPQNNGHDWLNGPLRPPMFEEKKKRKEEEAEPGTVGLQMLINPFRNDATKLRVPDFMVENRNHGFSNYSKLSSTGLQG